MISTDINLWIQAILILMFLSQLYKDNILYKFAEYTFIGVAVGHGTVLAYTSVVSMVYDQITVKGELILIVPIILGFLIWTRLSTKYSWISRLPISVIVGVGTSVAVRGVISAQIFNQIIGTITLATIQPNALATLNNFIIIVGTICTLSYFVFFKEKKGLLQITSKIGILAMMASFGNTIAWIFMGRIGPLIAEFQLLLLQLLGL